MLHEHIIVYCNAYNIERHNFIWLSRFISEKRTSLKYKDSEILLINGNYEANQTLINYFAENTETLEGVRFLNANFSEKDFFKKINADEAKSIYVLADINDANTDSHVFDMVYRLNKNTNYKNGITAELVHDANRNRLAKLGANVILRPNRSMPEMLITCTIAPGSAQMLEEITSRGGDSIERFNIPCTEFIWGKLLYELSMHNIGTATAIIYPPKNDESIEFIDPNPSGQGLVNNATAILILIHEMRTKDYGTIQAQIDSIFNDIVCKNKK